MTFSDALTIMALTPEQRNLEENVALVEKGCRPLHTHIPTHAFFTIYDPKYWDERDEAIREQNAAAMTAFAPPAEITLEPGIDPEEGE